jgi:hypothetical protein
LGSERPNVRLGQTVCVLLIMRGDLASRHPMHFSLRMLLIAATAAAVYIGSFLALIRTVAPYRASSPLAVVHYTCDLPLFVLWCVAGEWAFRRRSSASSARLMFAAILMIAAWRLFSPFVQALLFQFLEVNFGDVGVLQWYGVIATLINNIVEFTSWLLMTFAVIWGMNACPANSPSGRIFSMHFSLRTLLIVTTAATVYIGSFLALVRTVRPQRALTLLGIVRPTFGVPIFVLWCVAGEWAFRHRLSSSSARLMLAAILTIAAWRFLSPFAQALLFQFVTLNSENAYQWYGVIAALLGTIFEFASWLLMTFAVVQGLKASPEPEASSPWQAEATSG